MSELVLVLGDASSGKTTSLMKVDEPELGIQIDGLPPENTMIIDIISKGLPMKGWKKQYVEKVNYFPLLNRVDKTGDVLRILDHASKKENIKYIVIDDYQYIASYKFLDDVKAKRTSGNAVFERYNELVVMGKDLFDIFKSLRQDQIVIVICHSEKTVVKNSLEVIDKMKTVGQATDKFLTPEGMTNIILFAVSSMENGKPKKEFLTQTDGEKMGRSPIGMFPTLKIPNDMGKVVKYIENFNNG